MRSTSALVTAFCTSAAAGVGYYTAILAEVAGPLGHITAIDVDADLAQRARIHLAPWPQVEVVTDDGGQLDTGPCDAIFVNAGATHPRPLWLEPLRPGGRFPSRRKGTSRNSCASPGASALSGARAGGERAQRAAPPRDPGRTPRRWRRSYTARRDQGRRATPAPRGRLGPADGSGPGPGR